MSSHYLAPDDVRGCAYCFDPDSPTLRAALLAPPPREDTRLRAIALAEDLQFLHRLMRQQYAGYPDLLQHRSFDAPAFLAGWRELVRRADETVTFHEAIVAPLQTIRKLLPDNHFTFRGADAVLAREPSLTFSEFQAPLPAATATPAIILSENADVRRSTVRAAPRLRTDGSVDRVLTASTTGRASSQSVRYENKTIELHRRPPTARPSASTVDIPAYAWRTVEKTTVITLRRFAGPVAARDQLRQLPEDYPLHVARPHILFDLRGNSGGSLEYITTWIAQARQGVWQSYARLEVNGALWPCSRWNALVEQQIGDGSVDTTAAREERARLRATWPPHPPAQAAHLDPGVRQGSASHPYTGRVFVLVDRHSGSSGELAAVELQRALGATLVGERTAGTMQYGEVRRFVLPRTGLVCQLPTKRFFFGECDGEVESVGWPVDVYLEDSACDVEAVVPQLDKLAALHH
jgi:hypothetical protein